MAQATLTLTFTSGSQTTADDAKEAVRIFLLDGGGFETLEGVLMESATPMYPEQTGVTTSEITYDVTV